ncbi:MAG: hypothetical protein KDD40_05655 [Bdellovibrionales bacterium]|nr:hypothetical protein [Bdellovibrionales bacterium]
MLKWLLVTIIAFNVLGCDSGLESNIDNESKEQEEYVDLVNKATLKEIEDLKLIGDYRIDLVSKKVDPDVKKKFKISHLVTIIKYPIKTVVQGRQIPMYSVKALISYIPSEQNTSPITFPILLANVYFSSLTNEIAIILGPEDGRPTGGGMASGPLFLATGTIATEGFKFDRVYSGLGEFEPAFMYRLPSATN